MERIKTKLWRRRPQPQSQEPSQEEMETETEEIMDTPQRSSFLSLIHNSTPSFLSRSRSSEPVAAAATSNANTSTNTILESSQTISDFPPTLTQRVNLLSKENTHLQEVIQELNQQLNSVKETQISLISKTEDLEQSLNLERKRFLWQKNFYEKKILDLALATVSYRTNSNGDFESERKSILESFSNDNFYHETILELVTEQEIKESQLAEVKSYFDQEIKRLTEANESIIMEMLESNHEHVKQLVQAHEELIKDLLTGCEGLFDQMKEEYLKDAEVNVELKTKSGKKIWEQFQGFTREKKGIIVTGVLIITIATAGWASWGFIIWVWPRLLIFAESVAANPELLARWLTFLVAFLNSTQFQSFIKAWEEGQPLVTCLKSFLNSDVLSSALQMAPNLFSQLKSRSGMLVKI